MAIRPGWYISLNDPIQLLTEGGPLPIRQAPQGGQWAFVSAQVRGIGDDGMEIKAQFFDVETGALSFAARRSGATVPVVGDPSFVEPALDSRGALVHMPVCPIADSAGVYQRALRLVLEVSGTGAERQHGTTEIQVVPDCAAGTEAERAVCECECAADYDPGKCY